MTVGSVWADPGHGHLTPTPSKSSLRAACPPSSSTSPSRDRRITSIFKSRQVSLHRPCHHPHPHPHPHPDRQWLPRLNDPGRTCPVLGFDPFARRPPSSQPHEQRLKLPVAMERPRPQRSRGPLDAVTMDLAPADEAMPDDTLRTPTETTPRALGPSPLINKPRSLSDGGHDRQSPSHIDTSRFTKDDSVIRDPKQPVTPGRPDPSLRGLSLQMPPRDTFTPPPQPQNVASAVKPAPLSPRLDHAQIYASPTNMLPRRSRGLDFSRAATSLHHSTLAEQSSPDSSPTIAGSRAMSIPGRRGGFGGPEQTSTSLWSVMGNQERMQMSSSLGSALAVGSDTSSNSDDDDIMDEDQDDAFVTTPQVSKTTAIAGLSGGPFGSPAMNRLASFQQRQRTRRQPKKKMRAPLGLGFSASSMSKSPPSSSHARRESISWQANQLHISPTDADDASRVTSDAEGPSDGRNVIRRVVTRRGNLLVCQTLTHYPSLTGHSPRQETLPASAQPSPKRPPQPRQNSCARQR